MRQFTNKQKELAEIINSKEQKVLIAEFDMMLEDLRFLFNEVNNHYENILVFLDNYCLQSNPQ